MKIIIRYIYFCSFKSIILVIKVVYSQSLNILYFGLCKVNFLMTSTELHYDMFIDTTLDRIFLSYIVEHHPLSFPIFGLKPKN